AQAGTGELVIRTRAGAAAAGNWSAQWKPVAEAVAFARDLSTEPANALWPEEFVARVRTAAADLPLRIEVLDVPAMQKLGMGGILAVGQGSARPPRLLVVRYAGGAAGEAPLAFVGKGITFDTGGISLKPGSNMWQMKGAMTGRSWWSTWPRSPARSSPRWAATTPACSPVTMRSPPSCWRPARPAGRSCGGCRCAMNTASG